MDVYSQFETKTCRYKTGKEKKFFVTGKQSVFTLFIYLVHLHILIVFWLFHVYRNDKFL